MIEDKETAPTIRKAMLLIGVAIAFVVIIFIGSKLIVKTQLTTCQRNMQTINKCLDDYFDEKSGYPESLSDPELKQYFMKGYIPKDPSTGKAYVYKKEGNDYTFACPNPKNHGVKEIIGTPLGGVVITP